MVRNCSNLSQEAYDVLVIGGGIHGAFVAWDAALRGLKVALVEQNDFGSATSANSLKTVHGGLRYLQDGDLPLVRKMIRERKAYLKIAPHLVHPLPCLMPTYRPLKKNKLLLTPGLVVNDLIGFDRNRGQDESAHLPSSRPLSKQSIFEKLPGLKKEGVTGGVYWHDGQVYNSERFLLSVLQSAAQKGAHLVNYCSAKKLIHNKNLEDMVIGARVQDRLSGVELDVKARIVVNATGAWTDRLVDSKNAKSRFHLSTAVNLVVRKFIDGFGVGIFGEYQPDSTKPDKKQRLLFVSPWRNYSIIGTLHEFFDRDPAEFVVTPEKIQSFLTEVNRAYPGAKLTMEDVKLVHKGFLPRNEDRSGDVKLVRKGQVHDHAAEEGVAGLISVVGVKYTTARAVAEQAVNLIGEKLEKKLPKSRTHQTVLHGAQFENLADLLKEAKARFKVGLTDAELESLAFNYGINYEDILTAMQQNLTGDFSPSEKMISAQIRYAIKHEMAVKLTDIVLRRTELGSAGYPGDEAVALCAKVMAAELGWDVDKTQAEIEELQTIYNLKSMA